MPDDLDALIAAPARPGGKVCTVGWWLTHGSDPDIDRLAQAVAGNGPAVDVAAAFIRRGMDVGAQAVGRHRRGQCKCRR